MALSSSAVSVRCNENFLRAPQGRRLARSLMIYLLRARLHAVGAPVDKITDERCAVMLLNNIDDALVNRCFSARSTPSFTLR